MSRIGKLPITIPAGVSVEIHGSTIKAKGKLGERKFDAHPLMKVELKDNVVIVSKQNDEQLSRQLHGLTRTLIANMVTGVHTGFEKRLEVNGVGYRAKVSGKKLELSLGYSHPVSVTAPDEINFAMDEKLKNVIIITGIDKQAVGQVAANIRSLRKPEPYKGKGIKYMDEHIKRKAGKAASKE